MILSKKAFLCVEEALTDVGQPFGILKGSFPWCHPTEVARLVPEATRFELIWSKVAPEKSEEPCRPEPLRRPPPNPDKPLPQCNDSREHNDHH